MSEHREGASAETAEPKREEDQVVTAEKRELPPCNEEQRVLLRRCNAARDMREWNAWREANRGEVVALSNASLRDHWLQGADLRGAILVGADCREADFRGADLRGALLTGAHLAGAFVARGCKLQKAEAQYASTDGRTLLEDCEVDHSTDFTGVALRSARVEPELRAALEANVRRFRWKRWYEKHPRLARVVRRFWAVSDYGTSTAGVLRSFAKWALIFAVLYCIPGLVSGVYEEGIPGWAIPVRAVYFSVVTMTTLGFGDMHAATVFSPWHLAVGSVAGHVLLTLQVLLGYVLLGALVTRFAIMFQES
jgi:hypothetical protein